MKDRRALNIIVFSSWGNLKLYYLLESLFRNGMPAWAVILDGVCSQDARAILMERIRGYLIPPDFTDIESFSCPLYVVKNHNSAKCCELVRQLGADVIINGGTPRILKGDIFRAPRMGILNSHPGLLPKYRGCTCVEWSIYNGDEVGATCHFMVEQVDAGPIIYQEAMEIEEGDSYEAVRTKMIFHQNKVMLKGLVKINSAGIKRESFPEQDLESADYFNVIPNEKLERVRYLLSERKYQYLTKKKDIRRMP